MLIITKDNLNIISANFDDPEIKRILDDFELVKNLSEVNIYESDMPRSMTFKIEKEGQVIGVVGLKSIKWFNRKSEILVFLKREFQKQGIGNSALSELIDYVFNVMNFHRLEAEIFSYNKSAIALFEKLGFVREGILREARYLDGKYYDIFRYGLLRHEYTQA